MPRTYWSAFGPVPLSLIEVAERIAPRLDALGVRLSSTASGFGRSARMPEDAPELYFIGAAPKGRDLVTAARKATAEGLAGVGFHGTLDGWDFDVGLHHEAGATTLVFEEESHHFYARESSPAAFHAWVTQLITLQRARCDGLRVPLRQREARALRRASMRAWARAEQSAGLARPRGIAVPHAFAVGRAAVRVNARRSTPSPLSRRRSTPLRRS